MVKETKSCELTIHLQTGDCLTGRYHVDVATTSAVRPSDAIRQDTSPYLLLTGVRDGTGAEPGEKPVVLLNTNAITVIEIPSENWEL